MFGKKRVLLVVLVCLAAGTGLAGLATTLPVMIIARVIQGLGGAIFPLAFGIIRDEFPRERVAGGIALISGLLGIGGGLGIVLAGPILEHLDYHWLFWIPLALIVLTTIATVIVIPESPIRAPGTVNWTGAILLSLWLICLLLAISEAPTWGWLSARVIGLIVLAVVIAAVWVRAELRSPSPLVDMQMMRLRGVWTTNLTGFLIGFGMYSSFVLIPQFVETPTSTRYGFGSSVTQAGLFLVPSTLMMLIAAPIGGKMSGRFGSKVPLVLGATLTLLAFVLLTLAHSEHWQIYLASVLLGSGVGFSFASMANLIVEAVRPDQTGVATGMNAVMRTIGGAIGGQVAASLLAATPARRRVARRERLHALLCGHGARAPGGGRRGARRPRPQPGPLAPHQAPRAAGLRRLSPSSSRARSKAAASTSTGASRKVSPLPMALSDLAGTSSSTSGAIAPAMTAAGRPAARLRRARGRRPCPSASRHRPFPRP